MTSATTPPTSTAKTPAGQPRKSGRWKLWLGLAALVLIGVVIWQYPSWKAQAEVGSAYAARVACSCRFVQGRELGSCLTDFDPGTEMVSVEEIPDEQRIRASVPMLASRTARYAGATGCVLEPE